MFYCSSCGTPMIDYEGVKTCPCGMKIYYDPPSDLPPPGHQGTIHLLTPALLAITETPAK